MSCDRCTSLTDAGANGHLDCVKKYFININIKKEELEISAASHFAIQYGHIECFKYLYPFVKEECYFGNDYKMSTFLTYAVRGGHFEAVKCVVEMIKQNNIIIDNGGGLEESARYLHLDILEYLHKELNVNFEDDVSYKVLKEIMTSKYFIRSCMCRNYGKSDTEILKMQYEMFKYCINAGAKMDKYMWLTSTGTLFQYINNYEIFVKGMKEMDWEIDYLEGLDWELLDYLLYKIDEGDLKMKEDVEIDLTMFNDLTESLDLVKSGWIRKYLLKRDISGYSNLRGKVEESMKYLREVEKKLDELELGLVRDVIRYCVVKYL